MEKIYSKTGYTLKVEDKKDIAISKEKLQTNLDKMKSLKKNIDNNVANIEFDLGEIAKA